MTIQEIRVGNWYHSVKWNKPVQCELEDFYELCAKSDGATNHPPIDEVFEPIPLTSEWIEKFGFEKINHRIDGIIYKKDWLRISEHCQPLDWCGGYLHNNCKYVHTLQNLFFALTGSELTIKTHANV